MNVFKFLFLLCIYSIASNTYASLDVQLTVAGCNNDTVCQVDIGENINSCPNDCTPISQTLVPSSGPTFGTNALWKYSDFIITYGIDSVVITWNTTLPTQSKVSWGMSDDYSNGSVSEIGFVREHITKISNVIPGKKYFFSVRAHNVFNIENTYTGYFLLPKNLAYIPPTNVRNFRSFTAPIGIGLRWINPNDINFSYVRIVRLDTGYPLSFLDGKIVYEGSGQSVTDLDVQDNKQYYYAAFVRDHFQIYSSGTLLTATRYKKGITPLDSDTGFSYTEQPVTAIEDFPGYTLPFSDIEYIQNDNPISFTGSSISVHADFPLTVRISNEKWPLMFLTLASENQLYLIRMNDKNGKLEVNIPPMKTNQSVQYSIQILDKGKFYQIHKGVFDMYTFTAVSRGYIYWKEWLIIIPIAILIFIFMHRKCEDEDC